jgi:hypothetical protein
MSPDAPQPKSRDALPFEPKKKKAEGSGRPKSQPPRQKPSSPTASAPRGSLTLEETRIPDVVSKRMIRRMATFSGIPTGLGVGTMLGSYYVVSQGLFELPNVVVLLSSMGCFGLGVLGLSYGLLSTSWEETAAGSLLGLEEFRTNTGRMLQAWKETRAAAKARRGE